MKNYITKLLFAFLLLDFVGCAPAFSQVGTPCTIKTVNSITDVDSGIIINVNNPVPVDQQNLSDGQGHWIWLSNVDLYKYMGDNTFQDSKSCPSGTAPSSGTSGTLTVADACSDNYCRQQCIKLDGGHGDTWGHAGTMIKIDEHNYYLPYNDFSTGNAVLPNNKTQQFMVVFHSIYGMVCNSGAFSFAAPSKLVKQPTAFCCTPITPVVTVAPTVKQPGKPKK